MTSNLIVKVEQSEDKERSTLGKIRGDCGKGDIWTEPQKKKKKRARYNPPVLQGAYTSRQKEEQKIGKWER